MVITTTTFVYVMGSLGSLAFALYLTDRYNVEELSPRDKMAFSNYFVLSAIIGGLCAGLAYTGFSLWLLVSYPIGSLLWIVLYGSLLHVFEEIKGDN